MLPDTDPLWLPCVTLLPTGPPGSWPDPRVDTHSPNIQSLYKRELSTYCTPCSIVGAGGIAVSKRDQTLAPHPPWESTVYLGDVCMGGE